MDYYGIIFDLDETLLHKDKSISLNFISNFRLSA